MGVDDAPAFLDRAFGHADYAAGFPHVFDPGNAHWRFAERDASGEVVSFCACWPLVWAAGPRGVVRAACLGSVATRPGEERRGHALRVLNQATEAADARGLDALVLFAEAAKAQLYERAGFRAACGDAFVFLHPDASGEGAHANATRLARIHADLVGKGFRKSRSFFEADASSLRGEPLAAMVWQTLARLSPRCQVELDWRSFWEILATPSLRVLWVERARTEEGSLASRESEVTALAFHGKGHDFDNVLHGLVARDAREAMFLLGESALRRRDETVTLLVDGDETLLAPSLRLARSDDVRLFVRTPSADVFDAFRLRSLRLRGLQSC